MTLDANNIIDIYEGNLARKYDVSMNHFFAGFKKKAFERSSLKNGDSVLVFCCGTGLDFPHILEKIGSQGSIIGVDFSTKMLQFAREKIEQNAWHNIRLIQADITDFKNRLSIKADAGVCTLGLSLIPSFKQAFNNLLSNVKEEGEIIIGDMRLASGWKAIFNPVTLLLSRRYGGSREGHRNSLIIIEAAHKDLLNVKTQDFFMGAYYFMVGRKKTEKSFSSS